MHEQGLRFQKEGQVPDPIFYMSIMAVMQHVVNGLGADTVKQSISVAVSDMPDLKTNPKYGPQLSFCIWPTYDDPELEGFNLAHPLIQFMGLSAEKTVNYDGFRDVIPYSLAKHDMAHSSRAIYDINKFIEEMSRMYGITSTDSIEMLVDTQTRFSELVSSLKAEDQQLAGAVHGLNFSIGHEIGAVTHPGRMLSRMSNYTQKFSALKQLSFGKYVSIKNIKLPLLRNYMHFIRMNCKYMPQSFPAESGPTLAK